MHVLWPTDGSAGSHRALPLVRLVVRDPDDRLTVVTVDEPGHVDSVKTATGGIPRAEVDDAASIVAQAVERLAGLAAPVVGVPLQGVAASAIVEYARRVDPDLVVLSHYATRPRRLLLGSTSHAVAQHARQSVLVVRHMAAPRRILVADDGSPDARIALPLLQRLVTHPDARVRLLRVVETGPPATAVARPIRSVMRRVSRLVTAGEREARQVLGQRARAYQQAGLPRVTATVVRGDPRQTILREIARERADLVVVGATGSRAIRMMPGSIPEEILRRSGASVLVLRARPSGGAVELQ